MQPLLAILSGWLVGFSLGLIGGGGSILAVPLLLYVVGVSDPHIAIGTSALAVAVNAFANLAHHARAGTVKWPCAIVFAAAWVTGALLGSSLGKAVAGDKLLLLFAIFMIVVSGFMLRRQSFEGDPAVRLNRTIAVRLVAIGSMQSAKIASPCVRTNRAIPRRLDAYGLRDPVRSFCSLINTWRVPVCNLAATAVIRWYPSIFA